jgi:hypothetical protein
VARDATSRLYDVDQHRIVFKRNFDKEKYDFGDIVFQAKKGRLIDLDKLRESIWATRLSGGTRSGVVSLLVTIEGDVRIEQEQLIVLPSGSSRKFVLAGLPDAKTEKGEKGEKSGKGKFEALRAAVAQGEKVIRVTGTVDGWKGKWPEALKKIRMTPPKIFVSGFEITKAK